MTEAKKTEKTEQQTKEQPKQQTQQTPKTEKPKKVFKLPTKKNEPISELQRLSTLIYGPPKIGKSSFAAKYPKPIFFATEPGLRSLSTYDVEINSWKEFKTYCSLIASGEHDFQTVIIDTVDILYKQCSEHICKEFNIKHESDMDYGKGFAIVSNEFQRAITKLGNLPYGLVFISHAKDIETKTRTETITKNIPMLAGGARKILIGFVDLILFFNSKVVQDKETKEKVEKRFIFTRSTENFEAGVRLNDAVLPPVIPLDFNVFNETFKKAIKERNAKKS